MVGSRSAGKMSGHTGAVRGSCGAGLPGARSWCPGDP